MRFTATRCWAGSALLAIALIAGPMFAHSFPQGKSDSSPPTVRVGGDIKPPIKTKDVKPDYPRAAVDRRVQGVVIIEATIGTDGKVKDTKVIRPLQFLTDAAVDAVRAWEYKPTVIDGKPVQVIVTVPITFVLQ